MSNPSDAFRGTRCESCGKEIGEGNSVYFDDGTKLCEACAADNGNVCDCGQYKKAEFKSCYECSRT